MLASPPSLMRKLRCDTLEPAEWSEMQFTLSSARGRHLERIQDAVSLFIRETQERYSLEVDGFVHHCLRDKTLRGTLEPILEETRGYLFWLRWVGWNVSNLVPVLYRDTSLAAERLALGMLAYSAGRLIDDGLDNHETFKGHRTTLLASLHEHFPQLSVSASCVQSAFLGFCVFQYALRRMRECGQTKCASAILWLFDEMSVGVFAECVAPPTMSRTTYLQIIRRKAVLYNMILYKPLMQGVERRIGSRLLRILASMDELAQVLNDYLDWNDDKKGAQMNAFVLGIYTPGDLPAQVFLRIRKMWRAAAPLPAQVQDALAAMIENLGFGKILNRRAGS